MNLPAPLKDRCNGKCELCGCASELSTYSVPNSPSHRDATIALCALCHRQVSGTDLHTQHLRCLNDSMWSQIPAVQVTAWRLLHRLSSETWAQELTDIFYLEDELKSWAEAESLEAEPCLDSNGKPLNAGDNIVIIKDLNVKGTSFVAKRGTAVRNISLTDNPNHIEGRVNGTRIVILTQFVKKA